MRSVPSKRDPPAPTIPRRRGPVVQLADRDISPLWRHPQDGRPEGLVEVDDLVVVGCGDE